MRNNWLMARLRKAIRAELDNPIDMDDVQLDLCIEIANKHFYAHRTEPVELAFEGIVLCANMMLQRIRVMWATPEQIYRLAQANAAFDEWRKRVEEK